jgi:hypothetical protein
VLYQGKYIDVAQSIMEKRMMAAWEYTPIEPSIQGSQIHLRRSEDSAREFGMRSMSETMSTISLVSVVGRGVQTYFSF